MGPGAQIGERAETDLTQSTQQSSGRKVHAARCPAVPAAAAGAARRALLFSDLCKRPASASSAASAPSSRIPLLSGLGDDGIDRLRVAVDELDAGAGLWGRGGGGGGRGIVPR